MLTRGLKQVRQNNESAELHTKYNFDTKHNVDTKY